MRKVSNWLFATVILTSPFVFGQSMLSVSSTSAAPGSAATLTISLNTGYPGQSEGVQWTLNVPPTEISFYTTTAGPAATAAGKTLSCNNNTCLISGMTSTALSSGVVASVTLNLASSASGNIAVQVSSPYEALSNGDPGSISNANGVISVTSPVGITLAPLNATLYAAQTQQFTPTITGTTNTNVTWTLSPSVGSIGSSGLYTAPASISSPQTVTVTATSAADTTKSASATITLNPPVTVSVSPGTASLSASQQQQFTATVANTNNTAVTWTLNPAVGSISGSGLYTAPASITSTQTVAVIARSLADPTKSSSATVTLTPPVTVSVAPGSASLSASQQQQFTAAVVNTSNTAVIWAVNPAVGSISSTGLYTAPSSISSAQTVTVTATSAADSTKSASATVSLLPATISVTPGSSNLNAKQQQQFVATVTNSSNTSVSWGFARGTKGQGTISSTGLYTAPSTVTAPMSVTIVATSMANSTVSASATVSLMPSVSISLTPTSVSLGASQQQQFTATVSNTSNTGVTWTLSSAAGSITSGGLYTAPALIVSPQTVTVTATSNADSTKSATATISLTPPVTISVTPGAVSLGVGQQQQFTANVGNTSNTAVTWSLSSPIGSISSSGLYTAPAAVSTIQTVTVTATSQADPTKSASATIALLSVTVSPSPVTLTASQTKQFGVAVIGGISTNVKWTIVPPTTGQKLPSYGTISATGLYTAPNNTGKGVTIKIKATSVDNPLISGTATVNLN